MTHQRKISELNVGDVVLLADGREATIKRIDLMRIFDGDARLVVWKVGSDTGESIQSGDAVVALAGG